VWWQVLFHSWRDKVATSKFILKITQQSLFVKPSSLQRFCCGWLSVSMLYFKSSDTLARLEERDFWDNLKRTVSCCLQQQLQCLMAKIRSSEARPDRFTIKCILSIVTEIPKCLCSLISTYYKFWIIFWRRSTPQPACRCLLRKIVKKNFYLYSK
jgi:hypothetical protein